MRWYKTTPELKTLCPKLAAARVAAGLSQEEVGVRIGTHQTVVSKIDSSKLSDTIGEGLAKALVDYATAMSLPMPELEETSKRTMTVARTRPSRERRSLRATPARQPNEAAQLGVLNLVAAGSLKPQDALALLKSL